MLGEFPRNCQRCWFHNVKFLNQSSNDLQTFVTLNQGEKGIGKAGRVERSFVICPFAAHQWFFRNYCQQKHLFLSSLIFILSKINNPLPGWCYLVGSWLVSSGNRTGACKVVASMYSLVQAAPSDSFLGRFWFHRNMLDDLVKSEESTFEDPQDIMKKWYFMVVTQMQKSDKNATGTRWTIADRCFFCHILLKLFWTDETNQWVVTVYSKDVGEFKVGHHFQHAFLEWLENEVS